MKSQNFATTKSPNNEKIQRFELKPKLEDNQVKFQDIIVI